jgi:hypothetical protein
MRFPPLLPHGKIKRIFDDVFLVSGANVIMHDGERLQSSRNMVIVRQGHDIILINTIRLNEAALTDLASLGSVKHIIRLGAFHGRDDAFYQDRYGALLWAFPSMEFSHGERLDRDLSQGALPITNADLFCFTTTQFPEGLIVLHQDNGVLISCDSIKNWTTKDQFFDDKTFALMKESRSVGEALMDQTWLSAMKPSKEEVEQLLSLYFTHLISAHGSVLLNNAKEALKKSFLKACQLSFRT